jgi:predicted PurR-regulated permease PerM
MNLQPSPEWDSRTKRTIALVLLFLFLVLLWFARGIIPLVLISALLAFILNPITTLISRQVFRARETGGARRSFAVLITFLLALLGIIVLFLVIVPVIVQEFTLFGQRIPALVEEAETGLETFLSQPIIINNAPFMLEGEVFIPLDRIEEATGTRDLSQLLQLDALDLGAAVQTFLSSAQNLSGPAFSFVGGAFNTLINSIFLIMLTFYLLKDADHFIEATIELIPDDYQTDARRLVKALGNVWAAYLRGQLLLCLVMGFVVYVAASFLGLPNALLLGVLAGVLEFIPNLGPLIALIPAAFLALFSTSTTFTTLEGPVFMLVVIVVWTMLQNLESVFLVPRIIGDSLDLHPVVVMVAVLAGAAIAGALGVILAAPFVASGRVIARYIYGKLTNTNPFHEADAQRRAPQSNFFRDVLAGLWRLSRNLSRSFNKRSTNKVNDAD